MARLPSDMPTLRGVRHRWVQLASVRLHVAEAGEAGAEPLVLLHGWPQHWWCFRHLIPELAQRFRVLAPDLRGLGWSQAPRRGYEKATLADDIGALLDAEQIERAAVIGHDWGGFVAFLLALDRPSRVRRLMALDIPPPWSARPGARQLALPALASYQALLASPVLGAAVLRAGPAFVRAMLRLGSGPGYAWSARDLDLYAARLREPARARASSAYYRTFLTREAPAMFARGDRSAELSVPALLLMGADSAIDRTLRPRASGLLEVERVPGAGHFLPEEAPAAVLSAALSWFDGTPREAPGGRAATRAR
jgi:pimeloyl-ACP methyl ester carboxylesterase